MALWVGLTAGVGLAAQHSPLQPVATARTDTVTLPEGAVGVQLWVAVGPGEVQVTLEPVAGARKTLTLRAFNDALPPAKAGGDPTPLPLAGIEIAELRLRHYLRPNPLRLKPDARDRLLKAWDTLPTPHSQPLALAFGPEGGGVAGYLDGLYIGQLLPQGSLRSVRLNLPAGAAVSEAEYISSTHLTGDVARFLPLDLSARLRADKLAGAQVVHSDRHQAIPVNPLTPASLDLGLTAAHADRYTDYTYRTAFEGQPDSFIFTVPRAQYTRAFVWCAVPPDPALDPTLTARLTRFVPGGPYTGRARDCLADTTLTLPRDPRHVSPGITRVGTVTTAGQEWPLYRVEVSLASGDIQDLIFDETPPRGLTQIAPYLDFELLGRLRPQERPHPFGDGRYFPDARQVSGVQVLGVTLERTPVEMIVRPVQPGNVFTADEKPELKVVLRPREVGTYQLRWSIRDIERKAGGNGTKNLKLDPETGEQTVTISLRQPQLGWYEIECSLYQMDVPGGPRRLLSHDAAFALLPADTRRAGYESPYATWWFDHHYGSSDPQIIGPLLLKGGFRKAAYAVARHTEETLAPWKVTAAAVPWGGISNYQATDEQLEAAIQKTVSAYPHCDNILLFHESLPGAPLGTRTAPELFGLPVKEYPGAEERWGHVTRVAKLVRAKFPQLKIYLGNSGAASELIAEGLRRGFPKELADYIGVETVGRTGHPEKLWEGGLQGVWLLREIARHNGYPWGVTSCYETNYRQERLLGPERQAQWYVRDLLLSHAYRFPYISIALLHDVGNSYHGSFWGATGLCRRYPLLYPKPSYVAVATATRVLDRVTLRREVPTGSRSVYALEFARADGQTVTALWTARGTAALQLTVRGGMRAEMVDLYGRSRTLTPTGGKLSLIAGEAAQYLITSAPVTAVSCGRRTYPFDAPPVSYRQVKDMKQATEWVLDTATDPLLEQQARPHLPFRTAGQYRLQAVTDPEQGRCLEVELLPRPQPATPLLTQYGKLRLRQPVVLPGEPATLGMWVRGNSGWGQVYWEIEDAAGVRRISCGTVVHDADVFDYDGRVSLNYDGWAFLSFPLTDQSSIPDLSTGSVTNLWESTNRSRPVTYPVKLLGVAFATSEKALQLTEMVPVKQVIRFSGVGICR
jgi:hypothetical protein